MSKHSMPEMKEGSVNVTPLIDIIMCLIIFFMIVAKIGVTTGIDPELIKQAPATFRGEQITDLANAVVVNISASATARPSDKPDVKIVIGGVEKSLRVDHTADPKTNGRSSELRSFMQKEYESRKDDKGKKTLKVIINAPSSLKYYQLQQVLADLTMAGITDLYFATNKTPDSQRPAWDAAVSEILKAKNN